MIQSAANTATRAASLSSDSGTMPDPMAQMDSNAFLQLLVVQLRNQDPLDPVDNKQFIAQMAQLSTLNATNSLSGQVQNMVVQQQQTQALQMVGHQVFYQDQSGTTVQGAVSGVRLDTVPPLLIIGTDQISLAAIQKVL